MEREILCEPFRRCNVVLPLDDARNIRLCGIFVMRSGAAEINLKRCAVLYASGVM